MSIYPFVMIILDTIAGSYFLESVEFSEIFLQREMERGSNTSERRSAHLMSTRVFDNADDC